MKNSHYNEMVQLLMANPDGVRVSRIARHVYNSEVSLFDPDALSKYQRILLSLQRYLWTQSRKRKSPFERRGWGTYALKRHFVIQLELTFDDWDDEDIIIEPPQTNKKAVHDSELMNDLFAGFF